MFSALGLWGAIPICHQLFVNGHVWHVRTALTLDLLMGATYLIGATIYALRIPERWYPGRFDVWLHSHQIFHIAVVLGAYIHYKHVAARPAPPRPAAPAARRLVFGGEATFCFAAPAR